jgi:hypothetical protein
MTFGEYWKTVKNEYDSIVITYPNGKRFTLVDEENSWVETDSKRVVDIYFKDGGWKLNFEFPCDQKIKVSKGHIKAETIDMPDEPLKLEFYKKVKILNS